MPVWSILRPGAFPAPTSRVHERQGGDDIVHSSDSNRLHRIGFGAGTVLAMLALAAPAGADVPLQSLPPHLLGSDQLLGDPGGGRSRLERLGIDLQLFYNEFLSTKLSGGGARTRAGFGSSGSYDLFTRVDLEASTGWNGADALLHVKGHYDDNINADVGALSDPVDDADFDEALYVDELWLQQAFLRRRLRIRVGFMEQQTLFDRNAHANSEDRQFLASYLDNNALVPLPNGLAAAILVTPLPWLELALGIADADNEPRDAGFETFFDGARSWTGHLEARIRSPWESSGLPGAVRIGAFRDARKLTDFEAGQPERGHFGAYLSVDQRVWKGSGAGDRTLGLFARAGHADPDVSRVEWFWSAGFELFAPLPGRSEDVLGFGSYQTLASQSYRDEVDPRFDRETGFELYYAVQALGWLVITPDIQYIVDPGATREQGDAFVGSLRLRVRF